MKKIEKNFYRKSKYSGKNIYNRNQFFLNLYPGEKFLKSSK